MRAVTLAASIVVIGLYLLAAAAFALTATWVALGLLFITLSAAVLMVLADHPEAGAVA